MASRPAEPPLVLPVTLAADETPRDFVHRAYETERLVVFRYLISIGIDRDRALDLTQETFLKLYQVVREGQGIRALRAWLFTAASRLAIDHFRSQSAHPLVSGDDVERWLASLPDRAPGPESAALHRERLDALVRAFQTLSPQQRVCLHLRAEGLRYREIADALGVAIPTVSEFMRRALARLRGVIDV